MYICWYVCPIFDASSVKAIYTRGYQKVPSLTKKPNFWYLVIFSYIGKWTKSKEIQHSLTIKSKNDFNFWRVLFFVFFLITDMKWCKTNPPSKMHNTWKIKFWQYSLHKHGAFQSLLLNKNCILGSLLFQCWCYRSRDWNFPPITHNYFAL